MKKNDVWNEEINPDFISDPLDRQTHNLSSDVWDRGYYKETEDGIWYEVYVNDQIKKYYPKIDLNDEEQKETFGKFDSIMLDHYESDNQITFFVPIGESTYTLAELTDILI